MKEAEIFEIIINFEEAAFMVTLRELRSSDTKSTWRHQLTAILTFFFHV